MAKKPLTDAQVKKIGAVLRKIAEEYDADFAVFMMHHHESVEIWDCSDQRDPFWPRCSAAVKRSINATADAISEAEAIRLMRNN